MPFEVNQYVFLKHPQYSWAKAIVKSVAHSPGQGLRRRKSNEPPRVGEYIYTCHLCKINYEKKEVYNMQDVVSSYSDSGFSRSEVIELDSEDVLYPWVDESEKAVSDLLSLVDLHEATLLETLRKRFFDDLIYTYIGPICIAMNPFKWTIPWYQQDRMKDYINRAPNLVPHFWEIADTTFRDMVQGGDNQCILVSGNSGAGKTETVKQLIEYISHLSCVSNSSNASAQQLRQKMEEISDMIRESSPILEAFGNAKTINNDNSSRFGKFIQLQFDREGAIVGAHITNYLLEKSRLCYQAEEERTYHIFYQLLAGATDDELRKFFLSRRPDKYKIVFGGRCANVPSIDDVEDWKATRKAMNTLGLTMEEQSDILSITAAVLHLQNVEFVNNIEEQAQVKNWETVNIAASLLKIDPDILAKAMTTKSRVIMNKEIISPCSVEAASDTRNTITKAIYSSLFNWLIEKINSRLSAKSYDRFIGLLDIFGFETFEVNSFEQLCINYANEALQYHYNDYNFKRDINECKEEGIDVTSVTFRDNTPCIELIQGSKNSSGILQLLDEQCLFPKSTDQTFLSLITKSFSNHGHYSTDKLKHSEFYVEHFAGKVEYNVEGWLEKNKDELKENILHALRSSSNIFIASLVKDPPIVNRKPLTVGGSFRKQLMELMDMINSTVPHWVRCIKSHPAKAPNLLHGAEVMSQLLSSGVLETIKIRREGFCFRIPHYDFIEQYSVILGESKDSALGCNLPSKCQEILNKMGFTSEQGQVGRSKVFLRIEPRTLLNERKIVVQSELISVIQRYARMKNSADHLEIIHQRVLAERRKKAIENHKELLILISQLKMDKSFIEFQVIQNKQLDQSSLNQLSNNEDRLKILELCRLKMEACKKEMLVELQRRRDEALRAQREREEMLERMRLERENYERMKREREREEWLESERIRKEAKEREEREMQIAWEKEQQLKLLKKRRKRIEERNAKLEKLRLEREHVERQQIEGFLKAKQIFEEEQLEKERAREVELRAKIEKERKLEDLKAEFAASETKRLSDLYDMEDSEMEEKRKKELAKRYHIDAIKKQEYRDIEIKARDLRIKERKNQFILHQLKMAQVAEVEQMNRRREEKMERVKAKQLQIAKEQDRAYEQMTVRQELEDISQKIQEKLMKKRQKKRAQADLNHKRLMKLNQDEFKKIIDQKIYEEEMQFLKHNEEVQSKIDAVMRSIVRSPSKSRANVLSPRKSFNRPTSPYSVPNYSRLQSPSRALGTSPSTHTYSTHVDLSHIVLPESSPIRMEFRTSSPSRSRLKSPSRPMSPRRFKSPPIKKGLFSALLS